MALRNRLECKINFTLPALFPNKFNMTTQGLVTSSENIRSKRAIPALAIIQGIAATGGMMTKCVNALVDAKKTSSFNNAIKLVNENIQITHDKLITFKYHFEIFPFSMTERSISILFTTGIFTRVDYLRINELDLP